MSDDWGEEIPKVAKQDESAAEVFIAWERLRIVYNAILVVESLGLGLVSRHLREPGFWGMLVSGAIAANVCFCVGSSAEGYLHLLGLQRRGTRLSLFVLGTLFAVLLAGGAVLAFGLRGFD